MLLDPPELSGLGSAHKEQGWGTYTLSYFPSTPAHCSHSAALIVRGDWSLSEPVSPFGLQGKESSLTSGARGEGACRSLMGVCRPVKGLDVT